jgi:hypothetical protein
MKLLNITNIIRAAQTTFLRFPFVLSVAFVGVFAAWRLLAQNSPYWEHQLAILLFTAFIAMPLTFAFALMGERRLFGLQSYAMQGIAIALGVGYYFILPATSGYLNHFWIIQLILFFLTVHLLVAYAPYIRKFNINGFWQYNKTLFINILTSQIYTIVFFIGLVLSLLSIEKLFGVEVQREAYPRLFFVLQGVFNTWFFLSKVPHDFEELNESEDFPYGLKLFSQYVLLHLVSIYLVILYLYEAKILLRLSLPVGWVSTLVLAFAIVGLLCFLLLFPFGKKENHAWIVPFQRGFYWLLLPLLGLMFFAIVYRIQAYGFTENRYFVLLTGIWLTGIAIYFILSKKDNIALIPMSLSVLTFLSGIGNWSAYSFGVRGQQARLQTLFERNNIDPTNAPEDRIIRRKDAAEINSIVDYFYERSEIQKLYPTFCVTDADKVDTLVTQYEIQRYLLEKIRVPDIGYYSANEQDTTAITYLNPYQDFTQKDGLKYFTFEKFWDRKIINTRGYDYYISNLSKSSNDTNSLQIEPNFIINTFTQDSNRVYLVHDANIQTIDLTYFIGKIKAYSPQVLNEKNQAVPLDALTFNFSAPSYDVKLILRELRWHEKNDKTRIDDFTLELWLRRKK